MKKIHVGFLFSHDYEKLKLSIPPVYAASDRIFIAIDENYITWSGNKFEVDPDFFEWLKEIDTDNKIEIYRDNFYVPSLTEIEMDTRERHLLSLKMGIGNWLVQVDSDEYFFDFEKFVLDLRKHDHYLDNPEKNKIQIAAFWVILYKYTDNGILYVDLPMKAIFATNYPNYNLARRTSSRVIYTNNIVLHESLSRTEKELRFKLENWGHKRQVNAGFIDKWIKVNEKNYTELRDFYYIEPNRWKKLNYFPSRDLKEIKDFVVNSKVLTISPVYLALKNFGQWFKFLFK
ncbi:hypothetical protein [Flavobacterium pectinovorum]|uniref:Glycosyl transferase family 2 n=1 Tax=Flavobacterium pectinovorum TaxID=29533 RepID=A0AB36P158_9FLAO|nr:hypothetical protein [Flavobacterium pectinovorum]OXB04804.1 hypothetical protein B0A72_09995 [Flavobacterium pectinovorum]SHL40432.1 hypothetical protein SAMN05444387_0521 [Flavobacterium pectinovorum]